MNKWRREFGEEQVNTGVAHLLAHVTKCWQPSWHDFAGALVPSNLLKKDHPVASRPHAEQQFGTDGGSNPSRPLATSNLATTVVHSDSYITPPLPLRPVLLPGPFPETEAHARPPRSTSASIVKEVDESQLPPLPLRPVLLPGPFPETEAHVRPPSSTPASIVKEVDEDQTSVNLQSSKQESVPATELQGSLRPRRQARDNALVKIRKVQGQPKKRSRSSDKNLSPAAKRRRVPANRAKEPAVDAVEETNDMAEVETALEAVEEVIPPIKGTPFHS